MPIFTAEERLGTTLAGKYRLERILGQGGMGVVFEAEHTWTGRKVALKLLHPHYAMEGAVVQRFLQEARTATAIRHSNVVEVLDMGSEEGTTYLVLELLQGEPLSAMLERGPLSLADTLGVLLPAMSALSIAHEKGFIHRDLKPDNIFLHEHHGDIVPKVLDFGLSKALLQVSNSKTRTGDVMGTAYYMAPEQARGDPSVGPPADVWAMGAVMYECLSGKVPFDGPAPTVILMAVLTEDPRPLCSIAPVHPVVSEVVARALTRDVRVRYADMRALAMAVVEAARQAGLMVETPKSLHGGGREPTGPMTAHRSASFRQTPSSIVPKSVDGTTVDSPEVSAGFEETLAVPPAALPEPPAPAPPSFPATVVMAAEAAPSAPGGGIPLPAAGSGAVGWGPGPEAVPVGSSLPSAIELPGRRPTGLLILGGVVVVVLLGAGIGAAVVLSGEERPAPVAPAPAPPAPVEPAAEPAPPEPPAPEPVAAEETVVNQPGPASEPVVAPAPEEREARPPRSTATRDERTTRSGTTRTKRRPTLSNDWD